MYFNTTKEALNWIHKIYGIDITEKDITIDTELPYIQYVKEIIDNSESEVYAGNKKYYLYKSNKGLIPVNLWCENDFYFDGLQYIYGKYDVITKTIKPFKGELIYPFGWILSNPKEFLEMFGNKNKLEFNLYSFRRYGQPKLKKPKELKGIKQAFSVDYIPKKCKCQVFIKNNDVWIKHKDYFSPSLEPRQEDVGLPLSELSKKYLGYEKGKDSGFIYPDTWGEIVLRSEAWICIKNLMYRIKIGESEPSLKNQIVRQQEKYHNFKKNELHNSTMERFWENVIKKIKEYTKLQEGDL